MGQKNHDLPSATAAEEEARSKPAETLDRLEREVLGERPEDGRYAHDATEHATAPAHTQDLDEPGEEEGSVDGSTPPSEPPS